MNYLLVAGLMMWSAQLLSGCADSAFVEEYEYEEGAESSNDEQQQPLSDEVSKRLETVPGVSEVEIQVSETDASNRVYFFFVDQLIDHNDPSKGMFKQRCILRFKGNDRPVVLYTDGYNASTNVDRMSHNDIELYLNANYLEVEHRYFGDSQPEDPDDTDFTYLYTDQAAADLHAIVTLIQQHLFPRSNKWVSTGVSKDGITSALYAYYSDKNGWDDIDFYMPCCAPFITGTPTSCCNNVIGKYVAYTCGKGYPVGSIEEQAYRRLQAIPVAICTNKKLRDACLRELHQRDARNYMDIASIFTDSLEQAATAQAVASFYENMAQHFSYISYALWAKYVPDPAEAIAPEASEDEFNNLVNFIHIDNDGLIELIEKETEAVNETRSPWTDKDIVYYRQADPSFSYYIQAYRELGSYCYDLSRVKDDYIGPKLAELVPYYLSIDYSLGTRYAGQWDGGKLMTDVRNWTKTVSTKPILFYYSYNDPWTGAAIDDEAADPTRKVWKVVNLLGVHNSKFLDESYCDEAARQTIKNAIRTVLGM